MQPEPVKTTSKSLSGSSFAQSKECKNQVIEDKGYNKRGTRDIFGSSPPIYVEGCRKDDELLIRLWVARTKQITLRIMGDP